MYKRNLRPFLALSFVFSFIFFGCKKDTTPSAPANACYKIYRIVTQPASKRPSDYRAVNFGSEGDFGLTDTLLMTFSGDSGTYANQAADKKLLVNHQALVVNVTGQQYLYLKSNSIKLNLVFVDCGDGDFARIHTGVDPPQDYALLKHNRPNFINPSRGWYIFAYSFPGPDISTYNCYYETYNVDGENSGPVTRKDFQIIIKKP